MFAIKLHELLKLLIADLHFFFLLEKQTNVILSLQRYWT